MLGLELVLVQCRVCQERELVCQVQVNHDLEQSKYHNLKWKLSKG